MKTIKLGFAGVLLTFAIGACGGDDFPSKYNKLVDEMCNCKDAACAQKVEEKRDSLEGEFKKLSKDKRKGLRKEMKGIDRKYRDCRRKVPAGDDAPKTE